MSSDGRDPIHDRGNFSVRACAGSGKTYTLVNRYLERFMNGETDMLAITFTRLAAGEMQQRICATLKGELDTAVGKGDNARAETLQRLLHKLPEVPISTIHSFCQNVIGEYAPLLGLPQSIIVIEGAEVGRLQSRAVTRAVEDILSDQPSIPSAEVPDAREALYSLGPGDIAGLTAKAAASPLWLDRFEHAVKSGEFDALPATPRISKLEKCLQTLGISREEALQKKDLLLTSNGRPRKIGSVQKKWERAEHIDDDELERLLNDFSELVRTYNVEPLAALERKLMRGLASLFRCAREHLTVLKGHRLEFSDLIYHVHRLLTSREPALINAAAEIRSRYSHVFVDEFQDTDPLQWDIVQELCFQDGKLPQDKLFIVGDEQQSIYSFRNADVRVFRKAIGLMGGNTVSLELNRRSTRNVIAFCNKVFSQLFTDEAMNPEGIEHLPMESHRKKENGSVSVCFCEDAATEPHMVACEISRAIEQGTDPGDIAVLSRRHYELESVASRLALMGIPYSVRITDQFSKRRETGDVLAALRIICDPADDISAAHFLRSGLCAFTDDALALLYKRKNAPAAVFISENEPFDELDECDRVAWKRAGKVLLDLRRSAETKPFDRVLAKLVEECCAPLAYGLLPGGETAIASLEFMLWAARLAAREGKGLDEFIEQIENGQLISSSAATSQKGKVNLLTIHSSKGLEFKTVFIAGAGRGKYSDSHTKPSRVTTDSGELAVPFFRIASDYLASELPREVFDEIAGEDRAGYPGPYAHEAKAQESDLEKSEYLRFLYVACTRACDDLVLCGTYHRGRTVKFIKNSFLDLAVPELKTVLSKQEESGVLSIEDIPVNWRRYESLPASSPRSRAEIRTAHGGIEPPSATPKAKDAPGPFVRTKVISATVLSGLVAPRPQQPAGASESATGLAYGSALHALLEYRHAAARDVLSTLPGAELLNERQLIADRDRILAHPAVVAALAMPAVQPEWPFALLLTSPLADSNANLLVRGKADLFAVDGSCARIVDYKSGAMPSPELLCAYRAQLALYVCAVKNAYRDVSDVSASLVFTSTAEIVGPLSETELMKRIRKLSYKDVVAE